MAAKKKNPNTPPQTKRRKAAKAEATRVETPMAVTEATGDQTPPVEVTTTAPVPEAEPQPEVDNQPAEMPAAQTAAEPDRIADPPTPEADGTTKTTLRFWQVRRGPEIVGRTQAGTEKWALKQARKQFGADVTVEAGVEASTPAPAPKHRKQRGKKTEKDPSKLSALDAAAKVLGETGQPMTCQELIEAMAVKGYWSSPGGKTPHATLYSAMLREITTKGDQARFVKADRGKFALRPQA